MNKARPTQALFLFFLAINPAVQAINVIFDLHNVLVLTNKKAALARLPKKDLVFYSLLFRQTPQISLFNTLHKIKPLVATGTLYIGPTDDQGNPLPQLMVEWLNGSISAEEIVTLVNHACVQHPEWFAHPSEQRIVKALAAILFCPKRFAAIHQLHPHAFSIVKKCKEAGCKVYVLSNWDDESFVHMRQRFTDFFSLFDGIGISGNMKNTKPAQTIYEQLLATYQLNAADCWFVDDQPINLMGAQQAGLNTILCGKKGSWLTQPDLQDVWQRLSHAFEQSVTCGV